MHVLTASMWQLRRTMGSNWGLRFSTLLRIHESVLKLMITYAVVRGKRKNKKMIVAMLEDMRKLVLK